jgi:hypothetical protein
MVIGFQGTSCTVQGLALSDYGPWDKAGQTVKRSNVARFRALRRLDIDVVFDLTSTIFYSSKKTWNRTEWMIVNVSQWLWIGSASMIVKKWITVHHHQSQVRSTVERRIVSPIILADSSPQFCTVYWKYSWDMNGMKIWYEWSMGMFMGY